LQLYLISSYLNKTYFKSCFSLRCTCLSIREWMKAIWKLFTLSKNFQFYQYDINLFIKKRETSLILNWKVALILRILQSLIYFFKLFFHLLKYVIGNILLKQQKSSFRCFIEQWMFLSIEMIFISLILFGLIETIFLLFWIYSYILLFDFSCKAWNQTINVKIL
jgi:hypothetical protein